MGPLQGLRVIELAGIGPGPFCAMLLADLGADVVRIDRTEASDLGLPMDRRYDVNGRNRRSAALDLKSASGRAAVLRLVARADVLIEGFRPGVAERLGLGPAECHALNPRLVYGRMTGFGQSGPLAQAAGHDLNYIALSGALHAIGPAGGKPVPPLNLVGDYGGGALYLALGLLAALHERQTSGRGQVVDDAKYVAISALEPKFFAELAQRIGLDARFIERQHDRTTWPEMREAMAAILRGKTRDQWCALLEGSDACFAPVLSITEAPQHAHARARQAFIEIDGVVQPGPAPRFDRSTPDPVGPAPAPGAHTDQVLAEAGFSADEIAALHQAGAARRV